MLVSSHLLAEVAQTVDRVVILDHGRLAANTTLGELMARADGRGSPHTLEDVFLQLTSTSRSGEVGPMSLLARVELFKLATVRASYSLWAATVGLTIMFGAIEASRAGEPTSAVASLAAASGQSTVTTLTGWSLLFAAVLGVMVASGDTATQRRARPYLATPDRRRVLAAKAVAAALAGSLLGSFPVWCRWPSAWLLPAATDIAWSSAPAPLSPTSLAPPWVRRLVRRHRGRPRLAPAVPGRRHHHRLHVGPRGRVGHRWPLHLCPPLPSLYGGDHPGRDQARGGRLRPRPRPKRWLAPAFVAATALVAGAAVLLCAVAAVTTVQRDIA